MINSCFYLLRYIFESKENKKEADSKKKSKDTKGEKVPQQKVIARLQVDINLLLKQRFMISIVVYFATWRLQYRLLVFILSLFLQLSLFSSSNFFGGDD